MINILWFVVLDRYFAAETLLDCTSVLGATNTLRIIWTTVLKELERYQADRKVPPLRYDMI